MCQSQFQNFTKAKLILMVTTAGVKHVMPSSALSAENGNSVLRYFLTGILSQYGGFSHELFAHAYPAL